ncbi:transcobalamin-1 [Ctenodactylus gundi]
MAQSPQLPSMGLLLLPLVLSQLCSTCGSRLSSGQLAVTVLALEACHGPDEEFMRGSHLLSQLGSEFQAEIENMEAHDGNPRTNYYQLSLGVLALCLLRGNYSSTKVAELFAPDNGNYYLKGHFSVDTGSMAVLALTCVKSQLTDGKTEAEDRRRIDSYIQTLITKILGEKKENGLIGNTFSTGAAMQALLVSADYYRESEWQCQQTVDTVLSEISQGAFGVPAAAAQILPALLGKTYLDVSRYSPCIRTLGNFNLSMPEPEPATPPTSTSSSYISVHYSVQNRETYTTTVTVPGGSVFLEVMEEAQRQNATIFGFTVQQSSWGPYVISVQGRRANSNDRTYWELLSGGRALSQGVGSYVVHDGENLEVRWSQY